MENKLVFEPNGETFHIITDGKTVPIVVDPTVDESVHIAVATFADDVERISGHRPAVLARSSTPDEPAIVVRTAAQDDDQSLFGKWEAFRIRMDTDCKRLVVTGSDRVSVQSERDRETEKRVLTLSAWSNLRLVHLVGAHGSFALVLVE